MKRFATLLIAGLAILLIPQGQAFGPVSLSSNIPVNMEICNNVVSPSTCQLTRVGPEGISFQTSDWQFIIQTPIQIQWQNAGYFFDHWEDGSNNASRTLSNFPRNQTLTATYSVAKVAHVEDAWTLFLGCLGLVGAVGGWSFLIHRKALKREKEERLQAKKGR